MENAMPLLFLKSCLIVLIFAQIAEFVKTLVTVYSPPKVRPLVQRSGSGQRFGISEIQKVWLWPKDLYKPLLEDCLMKMTLFNEKDLLNPRTRMWGKWRGRLNERFASSRKYVWKSWDYQTFKDHFWPYLVYSHIAISPVPTTLVIVYCCRYDKRWSSVE